MRFARALPDGSPFAPREALAGKHARTLARELFAMTQEEFSAAFRGSPMKRAKLRGLKRNAAVVLGNVGTLDDVDVLSHALGDAEPLVRERPRGVLARLPVRWPAAAAPRCAANAELRLREPRAVARKESVRPRRQGA